MEPSRVGALPALADSALAEPIDVVSLGERLVVGDAESPRVRVLRRDGSLLTSFASNGGGPGETAQVAGLAVRGDSVFVSDALSGRVSVFTDDGAFVRAISVKGSFGALAIDTDGNLHVARGGSAATAQVIDGTTVDVLSQTGELVRRYGRFARPTDDRGTSLHNRSRLATDSRGGVWVLYTYRAEALYFDRTGTHTRTLRVPTPERWDIDAPYSLTSDDGMSYIVVRPTVADDIAVDNSGTAFVLVSLGHGEGREARSVLHVYSPQGLLRYSTVLRGRYRAVEHDRSRLLLLRHMRLNETVGIDTVLVR